MARDKAIYGFWFMALIAVPFAGFLGGHVSREELDNRPLEPFPTFTVEGIVSADAFQGLSRWLIDHVPLRGPVIRADAALDVALFRDSPNPQVWIGRDGWLFHAATVGRSCGEKEGLLQAAEDVQRIRRVVEASGRQFVFVMAPNKEAIYPKLVGSHALRASCAVPIRQAVRDALYRTPRPGILETFDLLARMRAETAEPIYRVNDQHWTPRVSVRIVEEIVSRLQPGLWEPDAIHAVGAMTQPGALAAMIGLHRLDVFEQFQLERPGVVVRQVTATGRYGPNDYETTSAAAPLLPGRVLVIHDSFLEPARTILPSYVRATTFLHWRGLEGLERAGRDWLRANLASYDAIILETWELHLAAWIEKVNPALLNDFVVALADDLPGVSQEVQLPPGAPLVGPSLPGKTPGIDRYGLVEVTSRGAAAVTLRPDDPSVPPVAYRVDPGAACVMFDLDAFADGQQVTLDPGSAQLARIRLLVLQHHEIP